MAVYYVRNGGSDSANGLTDGTAWATLAKVAASAGANDTVNLKCGSTWYETLSVPHEGMTLGQYGSGTAPIVRGTVQLGTFTEEATNQWSATLSGATATTAVWDGTTLLTDKKTSQVGLVNAGDWWHDTASNKLWVFKTSEPTAIEAALRHGFEVNGLIGCTISGLTIERCQNVCISAYLSTDVDVSDCTLRDATYHPIQFSTSSTGTVTDCTLANPGLRMGDGAGVEVIYGSSVTVDGCTLYCDETYSAGNIDAFMFEKGGGGACTGEVKNCTVYDFPGTGGACWNNAGGAVLIHDNVVADSRYHGFSINSNGDSSGVKIYRNVITGCGAVEDGHGIEVMTASTGVKIYHNVLSGNRKGLHIEDDCTGCDVRNNISAGSTSYELEIENGGESGMTLDYNCWYKPSGNVVRYKNTDYSNFATYKTASGEAHSIDVDPLLTGVYRLGAGSPCINAGVVISGIGQTTNDLPDMGAFESAFLGSYSKTRVPTGDSDVSSTFTLFPTSDTTRYGHVDDPVGAPDDNTTYIIGTNNGGGYSYHTFTAFDVPAASIITSVSVTYRSYGITTSASSSYGGIKVNGTRYPSAGADDPTAYGERTVTWTTNPNTGIAWTVADVNGTGTHPLQAFGIGGTDWNPDVRFTQVYASVTYAPLSSTSVAGSLGSLSVAGTAKVGRIATVGAALGALAVAATIAVSALGGSADTTFALETANRATSVAGTLGSLSTAADVNQEGDRATSVAAALGALESGASVAQENLGVADTTFALQAPVARATSAALTLGSLATSINVTGSGGIADTTFALMASSVWTEGQTVYPAWLGSVDPDRTSVTYEAQFSALGDFTDIWHSTYIFQGVSGLTTAWTIPYDAVTGDTDTCRLRIRARDAADELSVWEYSEAFTVIDAGQGLLVATLGNLQMRATAAVVNLPRAASVAGTLGSLSFAAGIDSYPIPAITIGSPDGGESWANDTLHDFTWTLSEEISEGEFWVWVVDSADTWTPVIQRMAPIAGTSYSVNWCISVMASTTYRLAVYYRYYTDRFDWISTDLSDATFNITGVGFDPDRTLNGAATLGSLASAATIGTTAPARATSAACTLGRIASASTTAINPKPPTPRATSVAITLGSLSASATAKKGSPTSVTVALGSLSSSATVHKGTLTSAVCTLGSLNSTGVLAESAIPGTNTASVSTTLGELGSGATVANVPPAKDVAAAATLGSLESGATCILGLPRAVSVEATLGALSFSATQSVPRLNASKGLKPHRHAGFAPVRPQGLKAPGPGHLLSVTPARHTSVSVTLGELVCAATIEEA